MWRTFCVCGIKFFREDSLENSFLLYNEGMRKIISAIVLFGGIMGSLFILGSYDEPAKKTGTPIFASDNSLKKIGSASSLEENGLASSADEENFTDRLLRDYKQELARANSEKAIINPEELAPPDKEILNELVAKQFDRDFGASLFEEKDIRVIDDSPEAWTDYFGALQTSYKKNSAGRGGAYFSAIAEAVSAGSAANLKDQTDFLLRQIDETLALPAPRRWVQFQLEILNIWRRKLEIARAVLGKDDDPIKMVAAVERLNEVVQAEENLLEAVSSL